MKTYLSDYLNYSKQSLERLDLDLLSKVIESLIQLKKREGRLFILGVGGSAANASHAVNDFRKICHIEAYAPTDNVAELTARTNDDGWSNVFVDWLQCSRLTANDGLLILSVGGGSIKNKLSVNLIKALDYANQLQSLTISLVGRTEGYCLTNAQLGIDLCVEAPSFLTPVSEAMQAMVWHAIVSHPALKSSEMTWESLR